MKRGLMLILCLLVTIALAYASTFSDVNPGDFNLGIYNNTIHNGTGVVLSGANVSGTYTSRIFDATSAARWNNISFSKQNLNKTYLFAADLSGSVYSSNNLGINWTQQTSGYGRTTDGQDMFSDNSGNIYILSNTNHEVWKSTNSGVNWSVVNKTFSSNDYLYAGEPDNTGNLFVASTTTTGIIFKSTNLGISWTAVNSTLSLGTLATTKGMTSNSTNSLFLVSGGGYVYSSINSGVTWNLLNSSYGRTSNAVAMFSDSNNNLYIISGINKEAWKSTNSGVSWSVVNETFSSNNLLTGIGDANGNIYVTNILGSVYKSSNQGVTWTLISDFNGASTSNAIGIANIFRQSNLTFQIRNCSLADCSDGSWQNSNLSSINLTGRYFQYKAYFSTQEANLTPLLYNVSLDYAILDNVPPSFSAYAETPANNSAYVSGQAYKFNVTINESNLARVWIEWQNVNYTSLTNISNVYTFTIPDLAAGTYAYRWWANDSVGNLNFSAIRYYTVAKAAPTTAMQITGTSPISYGTISDFAGNETNSGDGDCSYSSDRTNIIYGAGSWTFNYSTSGCSNYTAGSLTKTLAVDKAAPNLYLNLSSKNVFYGTSTTATGGNCSSQLSCIFYRNGAIVSNPDIKVLGAGNYAYIYSTSGNQNYTSGSTADILTVSKASTTTSVSASPSSSIAYGTASNFTCLNSAGLPGTLYINGINKTSENGAGIIRGAGNYTVNCTFAGNNNYTSSSEQINYEISKAEGNITLMLNGQENNLTIEYPRQYNATASTLYGGVTIYFNGSNVTSDNGLNVTPARAASYYNITAISSGDENHSAKSITRWLNVALDSSPPLISILSPQQDATYGYNESISLEYSASDEHLDSCWYNLDNGGNISLLNCANSTFNVSGDGVYSISVYANDSLGNLESESLNFSVKIGAPTITLISPINSYLNNHNINFVYVPSDIDLQSCELWGDFNGLFSLNQTNALPLNYSMNNFSLALEGGAYYWNIRCTDAAGHSSFNGNKTFYVDTASPAVSITQPSGKQTSRTGIPLTFSVSDASPTACWYNVEWAIGGIVKANTSILNCSSASFDLATDGNYILNLYVNDSAGNFNSANSSFSVDTSTPSPPPSGEGSGGGGGSAVIKKTAKNKTADLSATNIGNIIARAGDKKVLSLSVKNTGELFLNNCRLNMNGELKTWFYSSSIKGIAPGESFDFELSFNVPEEIKPDDYSGNLEVKCNEINHSQEIIVSVPEEYGGIRIIKVLQDKSGLSIEYSINGSLFTEETISVDLWLSDENESEISRFQDSFKAKNEIIDRNISMPLPSDILGGVYNLYFALASNPQDTVKKSIALNPWVTGKAIYDENSGKLGIYIIFIAIVVAAILFILRMNRKAEKNSKTTDKVLKKKRRLIKIKKEEDLKINDVDN